MPKRSAEEKIKHYERKLRKLNRKARRISTTSEEECEESRHSGLKLVSPDDVSGPTNDIINETAQNELDPASEMPELEPELEPELLEALGDDDVLEPEYGEKIHDDLAKRWLPVIKKGLPKETKEKLTKDYLVPENFKLLRAPTLNTEMLSALAETVKSRDKKLKNNQQQLATGITAANRALSVLLSNGDKLEAIKNLSNCCRVLLDLHAMETKWRRILITMSLDKSFNQIVHESESDDTLFGNNLSEKIKNLKNGQRLGQQFKKTPPVKTITTVFNSNRPATAGQGNAFRSRPSTSRGGRGGQKRTIPARQQQLPPTRTTYRSTNRSRATMRR